MSSKPDDLEAVRSSSILSQRSTLPSRNAFFGGLAKSSASPLMLREMLQSTRGLLSHLRIRRMGLSLLEVMILLLISSHLSLRRYHQVIISSLQPSPTTIDSRHQKQRGRKRLLLMICRRLVVLLVVREFKILLRLL